MNVIQPETRRAKAYDVFVSYKREDDAARDVLVNALNAAGYDVFWDGYLNHDHWKSELRDEINRSKLVICLWSALAAQSENVKAEAYHAFGNRKLLSAHIEARSVVPTYFKETNLFSFLGWRTAQDDTSEIDEIIQAVARIIGPGSLGLADTSLANRFIPVEFGDIPAPPSKLIGRETELAMLNRAWDSAAPTKTNAVILHALGGAGKSALLRTFANGLLANNGGGAQRIYGWSAYS